MSAIIAQDIPAAGISSLRAWLNFRESQPAKNSDVGEPVPAPKPAPKDVEEVAVESTPEERSGDTGGSEEDAEGPVPEPVPAPKPAPKEVVDEVSGDSREQDAEEPSTPAPVRTPQPPALFRQTILSPTYTLFAQLFLSSCSVTQQTGTLQRQPQL